MVEREREGLDPAGALSVRPSDNLSQREASWLTAALSSAEQDDDDVILDFACALTMESATSHHISRCDVDLGDDTFDDD